MHVEPTLAERHMPGENGAEIQTTDPRLGGLCDDISCSLGKGSRRSMMITARLCAPDRRNEYGMHISRNS